MQFLGPAKRWIQSVTDELKSMQWSQFCQALHTRFDRDQHEFLLRKMNRIRQTSSVQDYVDRFAELVDQLKAYDSSTSALHYITRFLDGLHTDIRAVLLVQRPDSLDTAYTLALLQEEASESTRKRDVKPWYPRVGYQAQGRQDHAPVEAPDKVVRHPKPLDQKLADLKAFRRARGLCDHCGEKWSRDHKCAAQVGLHVLDELYALFSVDDTVANLTDDDALDSTPTEDCCCLSADGLVHVPTKTLQFQGTFQQQPILILLDSGSSISFISQQLVSSLNVPTASCQTIAVRVANGAVMQCSSFLPSATWHIDQHKFVHDLKILPLV
jgi:hypothetical protein